MQQVVDELRDKRLPLWGGKDDYWQMWQHFANIYREVEEDAVGNERFVWQRSGPDHLCHALLYWRVGMDKFWNSDAPRFVTGTTVSKVIGAQKSWENMYDDRMPVSVPNLAFEDKSDWRDV